MSKFRQFLTALSARHMFVVSFPDDNLSKYQSIITKLGLGLLMGKFRKLLTNILISRISIEYFNNNGLCSRESGNIMSVL